MATFTSQEDPFCIIIPISDIDEIHQYKRSILNVLGKVNLDECDPESIDHVKVVYALLNHLESNERRLSESV